MEQIESNWDDIVQGETGENKLKWVWTTWSNVYKQEQTDSTVEEAGTSWNKVAQSAQYGTSCSNMEQIGTIWKRLEQRGTSWNSEFIITIAFTTCTRCFDGQILLLSSALSRAWETWQVTKSIYRWTTNINNVNAWQNMVHWTPL